MSSFSSDSTSPMSHGSEDARLSFDSPTNSGSSRRPCLFKRLSSKKEEKVQVLSPDSIAVEFIASKAGIVNPTERQRVVRREQRRGRSSSVTFRTLQNTSDYHHRK